MFSRWPPTLLSSFHHTALINISIYTIRSQQIFSRIMAFCCCYLFAGLKKIEKTNVSVAIFFGSLVEAKFIYIRENMENQNHCLCIKHAKLLVNADKHNLLAGYVCYVMNKAKTCGTTECLLRHETTPSLVKGESSMAAPRGTQIGSKNVLVNN